MHNNNMTTQEGPGNFSGPSVETISPGQWETEQEYRESLRHLAQADNANRDQMEELLYKLHQLLAGAGRGGEFTPFLRDEMHWGGERPYDKAMRWIARYRYRVGDISREELQRLQGNAAPKRKGTPLQPKDHPMKNVRPERPVLEQAFEVEAEESEDCPPISLTNDEIASDQQQLEEVSKNFPRLSLFRCMYTLAQDEWFKRSLRMQARRYGSSNLSETLFSIVLAGRKNAPEKDDWGVLTDEFEKEVGLNPQLAHESPWWEDEEKAVAADRLFMEMEDAERE